MLKTSVVWLAMVVVLVLVPDALEQWIPLDIARICGWVLASGIWMVVLDRDFRERYGPFVRFTLQLAAWLSAAILAVTISDRFRVTF